MKVIDKRSVKSRIKKNGNIFLLEYSRNRDVDELDKNSFMEKLPKYLENGKWFVIKEDWIERQRVEKIDKLVIYEGKLETDKEDIFIPRGITIACPYKENRSVLEIPDIPTTYNRKTGVIKISMLALEKIRKISGYIYYFKTDRIWSYIKSSMVIHDNVEDNTLNKVSVIYQGEA